MVVRGDRHPFEHGLDVVPLEFSELLSAERGEALLEQQ
jgi:hypothetical protein